MYAGLLAYTLLLSTRTLCTICSNNSGAFSVDGISEDTINKQNNEYLGGFRLDGLGENSESASQPDLMDELDAPVQTVSKGGMFDFFKSLGRRRNVKRKATKAARDVGNYRVYPVAGSASFDEDLQSRVRGQRNHVHIPHAVVNPGIDMNMILPKVEGGNDVIDQNEYDDEYDEDDDDVVRPGSAGSGSGSFPDSIPIAVTRSSSPGGKTTASLTPYSALAEVESSSFAALSQAQMEFEETQLSELESRRHELERAMGNEELPFATDTDEGIEQYLEAFELEADEIFKGMIGSYIEFPFLKQVVYDEETIGGHSASRFPNLTVLLSISFFSSRGTAASRDSSLVKQVLPLIEVNLSHPIGRFYISILDLILLLNPRGKTPITLYQEEKTRSEQQRVPGHARVDTVERTTDYGLLYDYTIRYLTKPLMAATKMLAMFPAVAGYDTRPVPILETEVTPSTVLDVRGNRGCISFKPLRRFLGAAFRMARRIPGLRSTRASQRNGGGDLNIDQHYREDGPSREDEQNREGQQSREGELQCVDSGPVDLMWPFQQAFPVGPKEVKVRKALDDLRARDKFRGTIQVQFNLSRFDHFRVSRTIWVDDPQTGRDVIECEGSPTDGIVRPPDELVQQGHISLLLDFGNEMRHFATYKVMPGDFPYLAAALLPAESLKPQDVSSLVDGHMFNTLIYYSSTSTSFYARCTFRKDNLLDPI